MRFTPILLAALVTLSIPAVVAAPLPSGGSVATADTLLVGGGVDDGGTALALEVNQTNATRDATVSSVEGDATLVAPGESFVVPIEYPEEPFATGFFSPQVDGILYGRLGEPLPSDRVGEWADAYPEQVSLYTSDEARLDGTLYTKQVGDQVYVGLDLDDVDPSSVVETWLQYDRDGDGELSVGDVRIVAPGPASEATAPTIQTFDGEGWVAGPFADGDGTEPVDTGLYAAAVGADGSFEAELNLKTLDGVFDTPRTVDDQPYYDVVRHGLLVRTTDDTYVLDGAFATANDGVLGVSAYRSYLHVPAFELALPRDDVGIERVELTQSVQRADNSLPVIRNKETLARVFVTHDNADPTEVEVRLTGWALGGGVRQLGTLSTTFTAPAGVPDRERQDDSANFELPDDWTDAEGLFVRAVVRRPGFVELDSSDNDKLAFVPLVETVDPVIYYIRLNTGSDSFPQLEPTANVNASLATLADVYPVADPQFVELDTSVIGSVQGLSTDERLQELNGAAAGIVLAFVLSGGDDDIPLPSQVFGYTPNYAGISDPAWSSSAASGLSIASIGSVDTAAHDRLVVAHEINHNIGDDDWGRHAGNSSSNAKENGCGAGGDDEWQTLYDKTYVNEVGWDPSVGIIPTEYPDYQSYCQIWEVTVPAWTGGNDPAQWVSDYRWIRMTERFENWDGNPIHPDLRSSSASSASADAETVSEKTLAGEAVSTARVVSGYLYADGGAELVPSFEQPGAVPEWLLPDGAVENPQAVLVVRYDDETERRIPLAVDFDDRHEEAVETERWPFTVALPDDGTIVGLSVRDPETDEVFDAFTAGGWTLESASFDLPVGFERGVTEQVGVSVATDATQPIYKRLLYTPDGSRYYPYGPVFTGESAPVRFEEFPGGTTAGFLLLVSDGVRTEFVESPTFQLSHAPPEVSIGRNDRWRTFSSPSNGPIPEALRPAGDFDGAEPTDRVTTTVRVAKPVEVGVGQPVSLDASGQDEFGRRLPASAYTWTVLSFLGDKPTVRLASTGPRFDEVFEFPGTYTVTVAVEDPATGLTAIDSIPVEVRAPPLPDSETFESFAGTDLTETTDAPAVDLSYTERSGLVTLAVSIEDPDDDVHLLWVDWPDGTQTERIVEGGSLTLTRTFTEEATVDVTVTALDDGFGVGQATTTVVVRDTRGLGYWRHQAAGRGNVDYDTAEFEALLADVTSASSVFSETIPADTAREATKVLRTAGPGIRTEAEAHLLAAWLNVASGGVTLTQPIDVDGDGLPDGSVESLLTEAEAVVGDASASHADLERAKDLAEAISRHDEA